MILRILHYNFEETPRGTISNVNIRHREIVEKVEKVSNSMFHNKK